MTEVLDGVTILSEETRYIVPLEGTIAFLAVGILILLATITFIIVAVHVGYDDWHLGAGISTIVSIVFISLSVVSFATRHPVYKVLVDENVSFVEFNEKYEVLKQDGLIYEVKERSNK